MSHKQINPTRSDAIAVRVILEKGWKTTNKVPIRKTKEVEGRTLSYLIDEDVDQEEIMKGIKINDYRLENIVENEQEFLMNESQFDPQTLLNLDRTNEILQKDLDRMDAEEWAQKYLNKSKEE